MAFLPDLSAQDTRLWFEDGPWRMPEPNPKAKALPEPDVLYFIKKFLN